MKTQASGLTDFLPFICFSAVWGQSCFLVHLASCISPAPQHLPWGVAASSGLQFWLPLFTFGSQKSLMAVTVMKSFSHAWLFETPWTVTYQAPLSMGILQARILTWIAIFPFRGTSQPRDQTQVSCIASRFFTCWATRKAQWLWHFLFIDMAGIIFISQKYKVWILNKYWSS